MNQEAIDYVLKTGRLPEHTHHEVEKWILENMPKDVEGFHRRMAKHLWMVPNVPWIYAIVRDVMNKESIPLDVVDIGCNIGVGSIFFEDGQYLGIDRRLPRTGAKDDSCPLNSFYNEGKPNITYQIEAFPSKKLSRQIAGKTVVASMSLGLYKDKDSFEKYTKALSDTKHLFTCTTDELTQMLKKHFPRHYHLSDHTETDPDYRTTRYPVTYFEL